MIGPVAPTVVTHAVAVTPSDSTVFTSPFTTLYVGGAGAVAVLMANDTVPVTLPAVPVGFIYNLNVVQVMATNTTATNIVGFW